PFTTPPELVVRLKRINFGWRLRFFRRLRFRFGFVCVRHVEETVETRADVQVSPQTFFSPLCRVSSRLDVRLVRVVSDPQPVVLTFDAGTNQYRQQFTASAQLNVQDRPLDASSFLPAQPERCV